MTQTDWSARAVKVIAGEVAWYRTHRKPRLSTKALADRTRQLGLEIKRSVLANLESGRRHTLSVPELLVLAEALEVAPALLIAPVRAGTVEILPGRQVDPWDAVMWINGESDRGIYLARLHQGYVQEWRQLEDRLAGPPRPALLGEDPMAQVVRDNRRGIEVAIRKVRTAMIEQGARPPALPPELAHVEDGGGDE